ncbi:hypothetical protein CSV78_05645 [Sporosarcina sp. P16a]|uniref:hypothetical protein n=1 Tax=unclassified Sporosarcina TaxID=2647733 RepID=UPI000C16E31E|nr:MULTISPECIES: hypothetical protein [unclassified Sporosarcina]PIC67795.1 hypothetical protein CSV78_05645 [Sporosarcina sp. P16a]PIC93420.1 hypothetical protein CSV70_05510 [Sporosarcina sp. P25]
MDIYQEFSARHFGAYLDSEEFLDYMLRQWLLKGRHLDVCHVIDHPSFTKVMNACREDERYALLVELSDLYESEITLASQYNETLLALAYGEDFDPFELDQDTRAKGDWRYHLWFYFFNNEGHVAESWQLFNSKIYPLCATMNNTRADHMQTLARYFNELSVLMDKTRDPDILESVTKKTIMNLYDLFLQVVHNGTMIDFATKRNFCERLIHMMKYKEMHSIGLEFYITFKDLFDLNDIPTVISLVNLSKSAFDYHAVHVLHGDLQAIQYRIEKYKGDIVSQLTKISEYILRMKNVIEEQHGGKIHEDSFIQADFNFFFYECGIEEMCTAKFSELPFEDQDAILRNLLNAMICFYKADKTLTSEEGNTKEPALNLLIGWELGNEGMKLRNRVLSLVPTVGIEYREIMISDALIQLDDFLTEFYLNDLSPNVEAIIQKSEQYDLEPINYKQALTLLEETFTSLHSHSTLIFSEEEKERFDRAGKQWPRLLKSNEVKRLLTIAEVKWRELENDFQPDIQQSSQKATFIIADYVKAVEEFIGHVLVSNRATKQTMPLIDVAMPESGLTSVEVGSEEYYHYVTLGSFYHYLSANGTSLLRKNVDKVKVIEYLTHWVNSIRTSSFGQIDELKIETAQVLRRETIVLLRRLVADLAD